MYFLLLKPLLTVEIQSNLVSDIDTLVSDMDNLIDYMYNFFFNVSPVVSPVVENCVPLTQMNNIVNIFNLDQDVMRSIIMLLNRNSVCQLGRCSKWFFKIFCDEDLWKLKISLQYQMTIGINRTALQSYQFCLYAGRKKTTGYDLFIITNWKEVKASNNLQIDAGHRMKDVKRLWKSLSVEQKNHWKLLASDPGQFTDVRLAWDALSETEKEKFGIAAANYKKRVEDEKKKTKLAPKKKSRRKNKKSLQQIVQS